ncbi:MAG: 5'-methylthioadenosine/adenosylhomocysteine nucleosidase [Firmicutes bacterium]|nr:5'-methylthioadenosine/adenosylhomocysteine nucleosidase [Bacillota bacterium]
MIGIIAAMDIEVDAVKEYAQISHSEEIGGCTYHYGTMFDQEIVLCKSGVGKVAAAICTSILCSKNKMDMVINVGTAGGLLVEEQVLDVVISDHVVEADFDTSPMDGEAGIGLQWNVEPKMVERCVKAAQRAGARYHIGTIASQDIFMEREEDFKKLMSRFPNSACSEMEAGAVGHVCSNFNVPYVIVRGLSDNVNHHENHMEFSEYATKASAQSAKIIAEFIKG